MITINKSFMTSIGVVSVNGCPDAVNQFSFFKNVEMADAAIVYNQYDFYKHATVDGVNHDDQYGFFKAIGEFHGEPIYDQYSFYQNATFDGTTPIGNQYNFFKGACEYIVGSASTAPTAAFSADITTTYTLDTVTFTDSSTTPSAPITGWTWDFGDGVSATTQNPTHAYSAVTAFTVALTVTSSGGTDTETKTNYIDVVDAVPTASWSADTMTGYTLDTVTFADLSTTPSVNHPVDGWAWDFGDGVSATTQNPTHAFSSVTAFSVSLEASTDQGSDSNAQDITIINAVPTADFSYTPSTGDTSTSFSFSGLSTTPSANHPLIAWAWDFGDGATASTQNPTHVYSAVSSGGTYSVSLTASTDQGSDNITKTDIIVVSSAETAGAIVMMTSFNQNRDMLETTNGIDWSLNSDWNGSVTGSCWAIAYNETLDIISAPNNDDSTDKFIYSTDKGVSWSSNTYSNSAAGFTAIGSNQLEGRFVAVGNSDVIGVSNDGINYTAATASDTCNFSHVVHASGFDMFMTQGRIGGNPSKSRITTSQDGITWTTRYTSTGNENSGSIGYSPDLGVNGRGVYIPRAGTTGYYSDDGTDWTSSFTCPSDWCFDIAWSPDLELFAATSLATERMYTSPSGITWTLRTAPTSGGWRRVVWSGELAKFVATASNNGAGSTSTAYSDDGITWTSGSTSGLEADNFWHGLVNVSN